MKRHLPALLKPRYGWFACLFFLSALMLHGETHPRLLFETGRIPDLRERVTREPYRSMLEDLEAFAEMDDSPSVQYAESTSAIKCGFLYLVTGEEAWAEKARGYVNARINDTGSAHGWDRNIKGLALYWHGRAVALAYDFCYSSISWQAPADPADPGGEAFRDRVRRKLKAQADRIYTDGGTEQNRNPASNWQNNRFASAGLIYLAIEESLDAGDHGRIEGCIEKVETYLVENMGDSPDSRGFNIESLGYTMYPWSFTGPFLIAAEKNGFTRAAEAAPAAAGYALWTVYSVTARIPNLWPGYLGIKPDFGDDSNHHRGEGSYGMAFYFCPPFLHPGLRYWYDRMVGELGDRTWDRKPFGTLFSILYYPDDVEPAPPGTIREWRNAMLETGGNGYFSFRNRYEDENDLIAMLYGKFRGNKGHNGPDALSFRIIGLGHPFAVGGGRYGPKINAADTGRRQDAYLRSMNTLYPVDPENELTISGESGRLVDVPQRFPDGGGRVSLHIERNNVDTVGHTRRFLADYSDQSGAAAAFVVSDTSENGNWWQLCQADLDPEVDAVTAGGNSFLIENPDGSSLKGTVVYPEGPLDWKTGTRIRGSSYGLDGGRFNENEYVHFQSEDGDYLVVMTVCGPDTPHPEVVPLGGTGANNGRQVRIGELTVSIDGDRISRGTVPAIPPEVIVESPEPLEVLAPGPADLHVTGRAAAGSAALRDLEVYYGPLSEFLGTGTLDRDSGEFACVIPDLPLGHHIFRVKAVDENDLATYSEYIPFSVHRSPPPRVRLELGTDGTVRASWNGAAGILYRVWVLSSEGAWAPYGEPLAGQGETITETLRGLPESFLLRVTAE